MERWSVRNCYSMSAFRQSDAEIEFLPHAKPSGDRLRRTFARARAGLHRMEPRPDRWLRRAVSSGGQVLASPVQIRLLRTGMSCRESAATPVGVAPFTIKPNSEQGHSSEP